MKIETHIHNVPAPNPASPAGVSNAIAQRSPFVSVVSVTLNCREDALLTAKSVWAQEGVDYEYIVKDGRSTDGTPEAIRRAGPAEILVATDTGIYDAMNQALSCCTGDYILFLNGGDRLAGSDALKLVAATAHEQSFPEIIYTHCANELLQCEMRAPPKLTKLFLYRRPICHQATYIKRECYSRFGGFDLSVPVVADHELLVRLVCGHAARAVLCPCVTAIYKDGGYTALPRNVLLANEGRRRIRSLHYSGRERLLFGLILVCTLHGLRQRLFKPNEKGIGGRIYQRLASRLLGAGSVPRALFKR